MSIWIRTKDKNLIELKESLYIDELQPIDRYVVYCGEDEEHRHWVYSSEDKEDCKAMIDGIWSEISNGKQFIDLELLEKAVIQNEEEPRVKLVPGDFEEINFGVDNKTNSIKEVSHDEEIEVNSFFRRSLV